MFNAAIWFDMFWLPLIWAMHFISAIEFGPINWQICALLLNWTYQTAENIYSSFKFLMAVYNVDSGKIVNDPEWIYIYIRRNEASLDISNIIFIFDDSNFWT